MHLSKTFSTFDVIHFGKLNFFFVGNGCASSSQWYRPQSIPPIGLKKTMKGVGVDSRGGGAMSSTNVIDLICTIAISGGGIGV